MSTKNLLIIDEFDDWLPLFSKAKLPSGESIIIEQTSWKKLHVEASSSAGCVCLLDKHDDPIYSSQKQSRVFKPDFVFIRNFPTDLHGRDYRNQLIGLMFCDLPSVNSLSSILATMNRPIAYAELLKVQKRVGFSKFPLVPMQYHSNASHGVRTSLIKIGQFPSVAKIGNTHAGYGKLMLNNASDYDDVQGVVSLNSQNFTVEPYIEHEYEFRVQKIGKHYRSYKRNSDSGWKGNWGNVKFEPHKMEDKYIQWADECSKILGGLDIFALDVLHMKDGQDYIIEINDTACGLWWEYEKEDKQHMINLVLERMTQAFEKKDL
eukprot:TRINITY_DN9615_c0_g1_i2.p1 TRINITY_DN9615_c0_g1~~TRINITY_DN9615_c0_g1_i2.p1  ORF type:complete len:320 (-),score=41.97 TRINITY_DN9615_c0_g1_i2:11-970(-)